MRRAFGLAAFYKGLPLLLLALVTCAAMPAPASHSHLASHAGFLTDFDSPADALEDILKEMRIILDTRRAAIDSVLPADYVVPKVEEASSEEPPASTEEPPAASYTDRVKSWFINAAEVVTEAGNTVISAGHSAWDYPTLWKLRRTVARRRAQEELERVDGLETENLILRDRVEDLVGVVKVQHDELAALKQQTQDLASQYDQLLLLVLFLSITVVAQGVAHHRQTQAMYKHLLAQRGPAPDQEDDEPRHERREAPRRMEAAEPPRQRVEGVGGGDVANDAGNVVNAGRRQEQQGARRQEERVLVARPYIPATATTLRRIARLPNRQPTAQPTTAISVFAPTASHSASTDARRCHSCGRLHLGDMELESLLRLLITLHTPVRPTTARA